MHEGQLEPHPHGLPSHSQRRREIAGLDWRIVRATIVVSLRLTRLDHPRQGSSMAHTPHPDLWLLKDPDPAPSNRHVGFFPFVQCAPIELLLN